MYKKKPAYHPSNQRSLNDKPALILWNKISERQFHNAILPKLFGKQLPFQVPQSIVFKCNTKSRPMSIANCWNYTFF